MEAGMLGDRLQPEGGGTGPHWLSDLDNCPSREGYLVLGGCDARRPSVLEQCEEGPGDPMFGIERCRCLKSDPMIVVTEPSGTIALRPHDLVRRDFKVKILCDL